MAGQDRLPKARKFFFDQNDFNDDFVPEPEVPPPPVFSEQELEAARKESYQQGKNDGLAEAAASREKKIADLLQKVTQNFSMLFSAEQERARQYEAEAVYLGRTIFNRLFPALNEKHGLEEVQRAVSLVLEKQSSQAEIIIDVPPDYVDPIQKLVDKAAAAGAMAGVCRVREDKALRSGDCRLRWNDGGASRDPAALADEIERIIEHILADRSRLRDNEEVEKKISADADSAAQEEVGK